MTGASPAHAPTNRMFTRVRERTVACAVDLSHHVRTGERRWSCLHKQHETPEVTGC
jgi:hypothetical protein